MSIKQYQYQYGDRPLEGYTIQRAAGRGGFGEVYYAISDSGRQVALKVIQNCTQIELRGISQCMNLKSPHLVTIFDIKHNEENIPFVIMEYVSGPSLRQLLDDCPQGLGEQKAAFFLREIAKGLSYLHDGGIVHRDLKPGNIFYENGYVKIGDYGLSKIINADHHTGQTITVGTVHYMAPEIGAGCYDRSIDIYALGILLYEMLTGQVPYFGASPGEVLMKHISGEPDLKGINDPFARVIRKALAKNPADRYDSAQEMIEDVFGAEHIRNSVSQFSHEDLAEVARRVAERAGSDRAARNNTPPPVREENSWENVGRKVGAIGDRVRDRIRDRMKEVRSHINVDQDRMAGIRSRLTELGSVPDETSSRDPLNRKQRWWLMIITLVVMALGTSFLATMSDFDQDFVPVLLIAMGMTTVATVVMLKARHGLLKNLEPSVWRSLLTCLIGTGGAFLPSIFFINEGNGLGGTLALSSLMIMALVFIDVWRMTAIDRDQRVSLTRAVLAAIMGAVLAAVFQIKYGVIPAGILASITLALQVGSPYIPMSLRHYYKGKVVSVPDEDQPPRAHDQDNKAKAPSNHYDNQATGVAPASPSTWASTGPETPSRLSILHVSPHRRFWALLLALFFPFGGMHRIYVGKIGTGILWFFTCGLFLIGQFIDIIMILSGEFRDVHGRPLLSWFDDPYQNGMMVEGAKPVELPSQVTHASTYGYRFHPLAALMSLLGGVCFLVMLICGLFTALHIPALIVAGFPEPGLAAELQRNLFDGDDQWPGMVNNISLIVTSVLFLLTAVFSILARMHKGAWHVIREVVGLGLVAISLLIMGDAIPVWRFSELSGLFAQNRIAAGLNQWFNMIGSEGMVMAGIVFIVAVTVLGWPARQPQLNRVVVADPQRQTEVQP